MGFLGIDEAKANAPFQPGASHQISIKPNPSANINVGDVVKFSGGVVTSTNLAGVGNRASAAGIAMQSNPYYDHYGVKVQRDKILVMREGVVRVSAHASAAGDVVLGQPFYPATTGSGVYAVTGNTGLAAVWATAHKQVVASASGTQTIGFGICVGTHKSPGNGGTGEISLLG